MAGKGLEQLAKRMDAFRQEAGIQTPKGRPNTEEIQFTEMDLIAGICSAALFGASNRNKDNFKSLISNPDKSSYLGRIVEHLEQSKAFIQETLFKNNTDAIIQNGAIKVHLESINNDILPILFDPNNSKNQNVKIENKNNDYVGKLLLKIDNSTNLNDIVESLNQLSQINDLSSLDNISKLSNLINSINNLPEITKDEEFLNSISQLIRIIDNINTIPSIQNKDLNVDVIKGFPRLFEELKNLDLNNIPQLDTEKINSSLQNIDHYITYLNGISASVDRLSNITFNNDFLNNTIPNIQKIFEEIDKLSQHQFRNIDELNQFNLNGLIENLTRIGFDKSDVPKIQQNLKELNSLFISPENRDSFKKLFENIGNLLKQTKFEEINTDIKAISNAINIIISIVSSDKKIHLSTLNTLINVTKKGGQIETLFDQVVELSQKTINDKPIRAIGEYFETITSLGEIGLRKRIRIYNNLKFIRTFVNIELPKLIDSFNKRFEHITEVKEIPGLYNLINLFELISNIGEISISNKLKIKTNLAYIRYFVLDDIVTLIQSFNKTISKELANVDLSQLNNFINTIVGIAQLEEEKLDNGQYAIRELFDIIVKGKYSLHNLLLKINENKDTFINAVDNLENLQNDIELLTNIVNSSKFNLRSINNIISNGTLIRKIELPLLVSIMKYIDKNFSSINDEFKQKIKDLYKNYIISISQFNTDILSLNLEPGKVIKLLQEIGKEIKTFPKLLKSISEVLNDESLNEIQNNSNLGNIEDIIKQIIISDQYISKLENTKKVFDTLEDFNEKVKAIVLVGKILGSFQNVLEKEAEIIITFIDKLQNINLEQVKNAETIIQELTKLMIISAAVLIIGALAMAFVNITDLLTFTLTLGVFVITMGGICILISKFFGDKNLDGFIDAVEGLMQIVLVSAGVLILGSLIMKMISPENLILFTTTLGGFVLLLSGVLFIISKMDLEKFVNVGMDLGILIAILGATLLYGSIISKLVGFDDLFKFAISLTAFMVMLSIPLFLFSKIKKPMFEGAKEFGELVFLCGMTLAMGALITHFVTFGDLFAFAFNLGIFMVMLSIPLTLIALGGGKILMRGAKELGMLVFMSAGALIIGALFMQIDGLWVEALKFAGILGLFIGMISLAIGLGTRIGGGRKAIQFGKDLNKLILLSAATLLIGGALFMLIPELPKNVLYFGLILGGFIMLVSLAFGIASKMMGAKAIITALALSVLIGITAGVLIAGPYFIQEYGISYSDILAFAGITLLYVVLFGAIMGVMGIFAAQIGLGLLCTVGIGLVTLGLAWVMLESHKMLSEINWKEFWEEWKNVGILFGIISGVVGILGAIMYTGIGAVIFAAGAAAMATIEALIWGIGKCVQAAAIGIMYLRAIKNENIEELVKPFGDFLKYTIAAIWNNTSLKELAYIKLVQKSINGLNQMVKDISQSILMWSKLPEGFDPEKAAQNIALIITCVGGSIMGLFGIGPFAKEMTQDQKDVAMEMLKVQPTGLFSVDTKFGMIVKASKGLGDVIKEIAEGAVEWNKLPKDFDANQAATNIALIITCVGGSIMGLFGAGPYADKMTQEQKDVAMEMLKVESGGLFRSRKTKFGMVVEASKGLGEVITKIAEGAIKWNKLPKDFDADLAAKNISTIITCVGSAIMGLYGVGPFANKLSEQEKQVAKEMFMTDNIFTGNNKFKRIVDSVSKVGGMISSIMEGVQSYANLRIPTKFDKSGKPTEWRPMTPVDFMLAQMNIGLIITTLGQAVARVGDSETFKGLFAGERIKNISIAIGNVSKVLSPIANSIWMYADGMFPVLEYKDGKLFTKGYFNVNKHGGIDKVIQRATDNIGKVILGLGKKIGKLMDDDDLEYLVDDADELKVFTESITLLTKTISSVFGSFNNIITKFPIMSQLVDTFIISPFETFVKGILFKNDDNDQVIKNMIEWLIDEGDDEVEDYANGLEKLSNSIKVLFTDIKSILDLNIDQNQVGTIPEILRKYLAVVPDIKNFVNQYNDDTSKVVNKYIDDVNRFLKLAKDTDEEYIERYNILRDGINAIYAATSTIQETEKFENHTKTLEKYVQAVNSIQISKVHSLTNLAEAVTELGDKIGNIDNFTNVLAHRLSNVLIKLTAQIKEAEAVIKNADTLHKKREELIKKSVMNITELMKQEMTVNIRKEEESTDLVTSPDSGDTTSPTDTSTNSSTNPSSTPSTTIPDTTTSKSPSKSKEKSGNSSSIINSKIDQMDQTINKIYNKVKKL